MESRVAAALQHSATELEFGSLWRVCLLGWAEAICRLRVSRSCDQPKVSREKVEAQLRETAMVHPPSSEGVTGQAESWLED